MQNRERKRILLWGDSKILSENMGASRPLNDGDVGKPGVGGGGVTMMSIQVEHHILMV